MCRSPRLRRFRSSSPCPRSTVSVTPPRCCPLQRTAGNQATNRALRRAVTFGRARPVLALAPSRGVARTPAATEERDGGVDGGVAGVTGPVDQEADDGVASNGATTGNAVAGGAVGGGGSVGGGSGGSGAGDAGSGSTGSDGGTASSSRTPAAVTPPVAGVAPPGARRRPAARARRQAAHARRLRAQGVRRAERSRHDQWGTAGGGALSDDQTSELVGDALLGGAAGGVVSGAGAFVVDTALNVAAKRIPYGSGFIAMGQMFTAGGPAAWWQAQSEATGYAAISGAAGLITGHDVDGKQLDWVERCEQALNALDGLNNILSLLSTILFIVAAAGFVLSFVFPPIAAFLPLIVQWAPLLGNLNSAIGVVLTLARLALMGIRVYQIKDEQADPGVQAKRAAALRKTTQQFSQELTLRWANKGRTAAEKKWGGGPAQPAPAADERSGGRKALSALSTALTGADVGEGFKGVSEANTRRTEIAEATAESDRRRAPRRPLGPRRRPGPLRGHEAPPAGTRGRDCRGGRGRQAPAAKQAALDAEHGPTGTEASPLAQQATDQAKSLEIKAGVKQQTADAVAKRVAFWDEHIAKAEVAGDAVAGREVPRGEGTLAGGREPAPGRGGCAARRRRPFAGDGRRAHARGSPRPDLRRLAAAGSRAGGGAPGPGARRGDRRRRATGRAQGDHRPPGGRGIAHRRGEQARCGLRAAGHGRRGHRPGDRLAAG